MYAAYEDYTNWLDGREELIPSSDFPFWSSQASSIVDMFTFYRLNDADILNKYKDTVISAICEVAELLYQNKEGAERQSWSIGSFSESFAKGEEIPLYTSVRAIIFRRLGRTGLLFTGVG